MQELIQSLNSFLVSLCFLPNQLHPALPYPLQPRQSLGLHHFAFLPQSSAELRLGSMGWM